MTQPPAGDPADRGFQARLSLESFDTFYKRHYPILVRYLTAQAIDSGWAEDIAQEAMIAAADKWDDLLTYERPDSWLFRVATRMLRRREAKARERCWLPEDLGSAEADLRIAAAKDDWVNDNLLLVAALRALPRRQAEVIALHFLADYTLAETALILGITEGTAKTHKFRGLERLRQLEGNRTASPDREPIPEPQSTLEASAPVPVEIPVQPGIKLPAEPVNSASLPPSAASANSASAT